MSETASLNEITVRFEAPNEGARGESPGSALEQPLQDDNDSYGDQGAAPVAENTKPQSVNAAVTSLNEESEQPAAVKGKQSDETIEDLAALLRDLLEAVSSPVTSNSTHTRRRKTARRKGKLFGLTKSSQPETRSNNPYDYEQKYPRDRFGEETADEARVWLTYLDEAEVFDRERVDGWKETVDVLLVFAGLFSGVVTTFVSQASQSLQQDNTQVSASLLFEITKLLRAQSSGTPLNNIPSSILTPTSPFTPSTNVFLVNSLWFTSLAITLSTALFAVLTKQWLYYYVTSISGTAKQRAKARQLRYKGFELWKVGAIVDLLPILLYLAVGIFLAGIIILLFPLDIRVAWTILIIAGITYSLYFISVILPILYPACPYTSSLTIYVGILFFFSPHFFRWIGAILNKGFQALWRIMRFYIFSATLRNVSQVVGQRMGFKALQRHLHHTYFLFRDSFFELAGVVGHGFSTLWNTLFTEEFPKFTKWREENIKKAVENAASLDFEAFDWLYEASPNRCVRRIIARCVAAHPGISQQWKFGIGNLWQTLDASETIADLRYGLCLDLLAREKIHWRLLRSKPDADECQLEEAEYQSYSCIGENVVDRDYDQIMKDAVGGNLKFPLAMWCYFFKKVSVGSISVDATIAARILTPTWSSLFEWKYDPTAQCGSIPNMGLVALNSEKLAWWKFDLLHRYFFNDTEPDYSLDKTFGIRYLLLVSVYRNLTSDQPLIADIEQRQKSLFNLFFDFFNWLCSRPRVSPENYFAFFIDICSVDAFWCESMTYRGREAAVMCLNQIRNSMNTDVANQFPFTECDDLTPIYQWCSQDGLDSQLSRYTTPLFTLLFVPRNRKHLCTILLNDPDAVSHFSTCLRNFEECEFGPSGRSLINRGLMDLLKSVDTKGPLFTILYNTSVLLQLWRFLSFHELNGKTFLSILNPKLYPPQNLRELHDLMKSEAQLERNRKRCSLLEASARDFGQSIDVAYPQLHPSVENQSTVEKKKNHDSEERAQPPKEPNGNEHDNNSIVHRMKKVFHSVWLKMAVK